MKNTINKVKITNAWNAWRKHRADKKKDTKFENIKMKTLFNLQSIERTYLELDMFRRPPKKYEASEAWASKVIVMLGTRIRNRKFKERQEASNWTKTLLKREVNKVSKEHSKSKPISTDSGDKEEKKVFAHLERVGIVNV